MLLHIISLDLWWFFLVLCVWNFPTWDNPYNAFNWNLSRRIIAWKPTTCTKYAVFDVYKVLGCENNKNQVNLQSKCDDQFPGKFISKNVWNCSRMHATMEQAWFTPFWISGWVNVFANVAMKRRVVNPVCGRNKSSLFLTTVLKNLQFWLLH